MFKSAVLFGLILISTFSAFPQSPTIQWQSSYGGNNTDRLVDVEITNTGNILAAGFSMSVTGDISGNHGSLDAWLLKLDANGALIWSKVYGGSFDDEAKTVIQTNDGGYLVAGSSVSSNGDVSTNAGGKDVWIFKTDTAGTILWEKSFGGSDDDVAYSVTQNNAGNIIVAATSSSNDGDVTGNHGAEDFWIIALDPNGVLLWEKTYGGSSFDRALDIIQTSDGNYVVVGGSVSVDGDITAPRGAFDGWVVKLDNLGNLIWQHSYGGTQEEGISAIVETANNQLSFVANTVSDDGDVTGSIFTNLDNAVWIVDIDGTSGAINRQQTYGGGLNDFACDLEQRANGNIVVFGTSDSDDIDLTNNNGFFDFWLFEIDAPGTIQYSRSYGGSDFEFATDLALVGSDDIVLVGASLSNDIDLSFNQGFQDGWVVGLKLPNATGIDEVVTVKEITISPNPSNGLITVLLSGIRTGLITIHDATGRSVLQRSFYGTQETLDLRKEPAGVYLITVETDQGVFYEKVIIE